MACKAGFYKALPGAAACEGCPAGKFVGSIAAVKCQDCWAHSASTEGSASCFCVAVCVCVCVRARARERASERASMCERANDVCTPFKYQNSNICLLTHTRAQGYTGDGSSCTACGKGHYKAAAGSGACVNCAAGTYQDQTASIDCKHCAANSQSSDGSSVCLCNAGFTGHGAACVACHAGKYKAAAGSAACVDCAAGTYQDAAASAVCKGAR